MSREKRRRQKENRRARDDAELQLPEISDAEFDALLDELTVRADCEHASTRATTDGLVLTRCAVGASVGGACPVACERFERRRIGGYGLGLA